MVSSRHANVPYDHRAIVTSRNYCIVVYPLHTIGCLRVTLNSAQEVLCLQFKDVQLSKKQYYLAVFAAKHGIFPRRRYT